MAHPEGVRKIFTIPPFGIHLIAGIYCIGEFLNIMV